MDGEKLVLTYVSIDGEEGYPGTLTATVTYEVTADNVLRLSYQATCDADTVVLLTHHAYFNLSGAVRVDGGVYSHQSLLPNLFCPPLNPRALAALAATTWRLRPNSTWRRWS